MWLGRTCGARRSHICRLEVGSHIRRRADEAEEIAADTLEAVRPASTEKPHVGAKSEMREFFTRSLPINRSRVV